MSAQLNLVTALTYPSYWQLLSDADRYQYGFLRAAMSSPSNKNQRNKRVETFSDSLEAIRAFAIRGDGNDWARCLVCGIAWLPDGSIAINTHQLRLLIFKCKSSINGSLLKMGYIHTLGRTETSDIISEYFSLIKDNTSEMRQWTIRTKDCGIITPPKKEEEMLHIPMQYSPAPEIDNEQPSIKSTPAPQEENINIEYQFESFADTQPFFWESTDDFQFW